VLVRQIGDERFSALRNQRLQTFGAPADGANFQSLGE
jgi:hypothetical protein